MVHLCAGQRVALAGEANSRSRVEPRAIGGSEQISAESRVAAHIAGARSAIAQLHGDGIIRMSRQNPSRPSDRSAAVFQFHDVYPGVAMFAAMNPKRLLQTELLGRGRADE